MNLAAAGISVFLGCATQSETIRPAGFEPCSESIGRVRTTTEGLISALQSEEEPDKVRIAQSLGDASLALYKIKYAQQEDGLCQSLSQEEIAHAAMHLLADKDANVRSAGSSLLSIVLTHSDKTLAGELGGVYSGELKVALFDESPYVRAETISSLGMVCSGLTPDNRLCKGVAPVIEGLSRYDHAMVRESAVFALRHIRPQSAAIIDALGDENPLVRRAAILSSSGGPTYSEKVKEMSANDPSPMVRFTAGCALGIRAKTECLPGSD